MQNTYVIRQRLAVLIVRDNAMMMTFAPLTLTKMKTDLSFSISTPTFPLSISTIDAIKATFWEGIYIVYYENMFNEGVLFDARTY